MSEFSNIITSQAGFRLIELSITMGKPLIFTKIEIGKGLNAEGGGRESLIEKTIDSPITRVAEVANADVDESRLALYFAYSNDTVEEGYSMTEVGLWAKVTSESYTDKDWDGYQGEEVFFGYSYADSPEKGSWIPDKTHKMDVQEFAIYASVGNATSVGVEIVESQYARLEDFTFHVFDVDAHNDFKGCTPTANGVRGFVPKPNQGDEEKFLSAEGGWKKAKMTPLELVNILYPKGIILPFADGTDPNEIWQGTTWKRTLQGRVAVGAGEYWENGKKYTYEVGDTGGEAEHQLTERENGPHSHGVSVSCSTNGAHFHGGRGDVKPDNPLGVYGDHGGYAGASGTDQDNWLGKPTTDGAHSHTVTVSLSSSGGGQGHENRQPYQGVAYWERTA